jgi:DNA polymerase III delta prime subunit
MTEEFLWMEKYRPKTIEDTILPEDLKKVFKQFVEQKNIPNLILAGPAGIGKTTVAKAMLEELGSNYIVVNGSLDRNIDTLRVTIQQFASSMSLVDGRKYVILDEADYLNPNSTQPALRNFMEEYASNCGFILTCNYKNKIITPLHSRCSVVDFRLDKAYKKDILTQFYKRLVNILKAENVPFDKNVLVEFIKRYSPDWRRIINELQRYSATGAIDSGILTSFQEISIKQLIDDMKDKNITNVRKWAAENTNNDQVSLFRKFYDTAAEYFTPVGVAQLILYIGKYQYQAAFVSDPEINIASFLTEVMVECEFK